MKKELEIGTLESGRKFVLPLEFLLHTLAIIGIRGSGKTVAATVIAEEMCEAGLLFAAIDPVSVWWGLRVNPDGSPGGYPVVIIGGQHADIPLEKDSGARIADAAATTAPPPTRRSASAMLLLMLCAACESGGTSVSIVRQSRIAEG